MNMFYKFFLFICLLLFTSPYFIYSSQIKVTDKSFSIIIADSTSSASDTTKIIGTIFTKAEADSLFGPVQYSDTMRTEVLMQLVNKSPQYLMFSFLDGKANILNSSREVIYGTLGTVKAEQVFKLFSSSKVQELITTGVEDITIIELRTNALTLTNGTIVLEEGSPCPPKCP
ncbi:MAG: hypothetical protein P4L45_11815 [Ignavibacteriaceae bacterium]|nr:hypothetical protein [Ignavibacteriaceae bacterium]